MRAIVVCMLLLAACTVQTTCGPDELPLELGGCCLDADGNGLCDAYEEPTEVPEEAPDIPEEPVVNETIVEPEPVDTQSATEIYEVEFLDEFRTFSYYIDTQYGKVWVWMEPDRTLYMPVQNLFIVKDRVVERSQYDHIVTSTNIIEDIEERKLPLMSMLSCNEETGKCDGCFVDSSYFDLNNCIDDWPNDNPVIQYNVQFDHPDNPPDWLREFHGKTPEIRENRTYRDSDGKQYLVDELEFDTREGSTVLYIHSGFGIPIEVSFFGDDGKEKDDIVFERPVYNTQNVYNGAPRLEAIYRE